MDAGREALSHGRMAEATACYCNAVAGRPDDAQARIALGYVLVEQSLYSEAKPHLNRAVLLDADSPDANYLLGKALLEMADLAGAIASLHAALSLKPDFEFAMRDLSRALFENGQKERARALISKGAELFPHSADFQYYQGNLWADELRHEDAFESYGRALALRPDFVEVYENLAQVLVELGRVEQAIASARRALALHPGSMGAHHNLLWAMLFLPAGDGDTYIAEARAFGSKAAAAALPFSSWSGSALKAASRDAAQRLRVGFVSGDFAVHAVGFLLDGILPRLNPGKLELYAYSMNQHDDGLTERLKRSFAQWTPIAGLSDKQAAHRIHADRVDILIDLSGHSARNRLPVFAWKPAPVQVSWLGYLASTGVPGMDYILADPLSAPETLHHQFTERVWWLPQTFNCFTPPPAQANLSLVPPPALRNGYITFGSFQRMNKITEEVLALWARVLHGCPTARLRLQNAQLGNQSGRARVGEILQRHGVADDRVIFAGATSGRDEYLASYSQVDVVLDTYPYPGVTTTGEALWMGVPTITLGGGTMLRRIGASLLTCAGLPEWVAWSEDEYVAIATRHALNMNALTLLRQELRDRVAATSLFDAERFAPELENALLAMWQSGASRQ